MNIPAPAELPSGQNRWNWALLFVALLVCKMGAIWPFAPIEGDEIGVINGIDDWIATGSETPLNAYLYDAQPGSYHLLRLLMAMTGSSALAVFAASSAVGAVVFLLLVSAWVGTRVGSGVFLPGVVILLGFQEASAAACYANTTALAVPFVFGGMLLLLVKTRIGLCSVLSALLIAIGGLIRLDALLIAPAVCLPANDPASWRKHLWRTVGVGVLSATLLVVFYEAVGARWQEVAAVSHGRGDRVSLSHFGRYALSYASIAGLLLSGIGLFQMVRERRGLLLAGLLVGVAGLLVLHGRILTTPKYLYPALPFLALPACAAARRLWFSFNDGARPAIRSALTVLPLWVLVIENVVGVRTAGARMWEDEPTPTFLSTAGFKHPLEAVQLVIGPGEIVRTDDGPRLRTGLLFTSLMWWSQKGKMLETARIARTILDSEPDSFVFVTAYMSLQWIEGYARTNGFTHSSREVHPLSQKSHLTVWSTSTRRLTVAQVNHDDHQAIVFRDYLRRPPFGQIVHLITDRGRETAAMLGFSTADWSLLNSTDSPPMSLYTRHTPAELPPSGGIISTSVKDE